MAYRPFDLVPGTRIRFEVHGRDGTHMEMDGRVDAVPVAGGNMAMQVRLVDVVARVLPEPDPDA